jgi:hypothetical protein
MLMVTSRRALLLLAYPGAFLSPVLTSRGRFYVRKAIVAASVQIIGRTPYASWTEVINGVVLVAAAALSSIVRPAGQ